MKDSIPAWHAAHCHGCPYCSDELGRALMMAPHEKVKWLKQQNDTLLRSLQGGGTMKHEPRYVEQHTEAPKPIDIGARIRDAQAEAAAVEAATGKKIPRHAAGNKVPTFSGPYADAKSRIAAQGGHAELFEAMLPPRVAPPKEGE